MTGSAFPFAANGSIGVVWNVVRDRSSTTPVARIWPGSARAMTRAAVLIASPSTAYVRRYGGPKSPVNTWPESRPARTGISPGRSITSRARRNACSSSWPVVDGAPAVKKNLDAALRDVGHVERNVVALGDLLDRADALVERLRERRRTDLGEQHIGVHQVEEHRGDRAMLRLAALEQDVLARGDRDARRDVDLAHATDVRSGRLVDVRHGDEQADAALTQADARRSETLGERRAEPDLAGIGAALDHRRLGGDRPCHEQLAVDAAREEEVDRPGRDPDRHPQRRPRATHAHPPDGRDRSLHLPRRTRGAALVAVALEEEQHRVASPLEQAGAPAVRLVEQRAEDRVERVAQQLRADLPAPVEALGQRGEARDVDERERPFNRPVPRLRRVAQPLDLEPRNVRLQHLASVV